MLIRTTEQFLTVPGWPERGICAGFFGAGLKPEETAEEGFARRCRGLALHRLSQTHSVTWWPAGALIDNGSQAPRLQGDAIIFRHQDLIANPPHAFGVVTADCVPLIGICKGGGFLIHAGWRGIAGGIIENTLAGMRGLSTAGLQIAIGPCAGGNTYEVGPEVIEALGASVVYRPSRVQKSHLDLAATVSARIQRIIPEAEIYPSGICTITDPEWHSFRRDGAAMRSNVAFVAAC